VKTKPESAGRGIRRPAKNDKVQEGDRELEGAGLSSQEMSLLSGGSIALGKEGKVGKKSEVSSRTARLPLR